MQKRDFNKKIKEMFIGSTKKFDIGNNQMEVILASDLLKETNNRLRNKVCYFKYHREKEVGGKMKSLVSMLTLNKFPFMGIMRDFRKGTYGLEVLVEKPIIRDFEPPYHKIVDFNPIMIHPNSFDEDIVMGGTYTTWVPMQQILVFNYSYEWSQMENEETSIMGTILSLLGQLDNVNNTDSLRHVLKRVHPQLFFNGEGLDRLIYVIVDDIGIDDLVKESKVTDISKKYFTLTVKDIELRLYLLIPPPDITYLQFKDNSNFK